VVRRAVGFAILAAALAACGDDGATTGPDAGDDVDAPRTDANEGVDMPGVPTACVPDRGMIDRPDDTGLDQIRVLYVVPSDLADRLRDTNGQICNSARAFATWFHARTGSSYLRLDTHGGLLDIGFVRLAKTDAQMRGTDPNNTSIATGTAFVRERIERELEAMNLIAPNKLYAVYYEGSSVYACGGGAYPPLIEDRVGAMYLGGMPPGVTMPCGETRPWGQPSLTPNYIDYGMLHELVHSLGFVPEGAPNQHTYGHVYDGASTEPSRDLMYSPRTSSDPSWNIDAAGGLLLDINGDDYYTTSPALDLANSTLLAPLPASATRPIGW
jgi:hypothetical protein